jgi:mannitol-1-phosphate 5-dehydrogenase
MKLAVQFGAGNIGRGFMGQLLWEAGYRTTFVDAVKPLVEALNRSGRYPLKLLDARTQSEIDLTIDPIEAVTTEDSRNVIESLTGAGVIGTAVGVQNLPAIAPVIADGIQARFEAGGEPVDIYLCENVLNAAEILRTEVEGLIESGDTLEWMASHIGFVGTVVARMVPSVGDRYAGEDPLLVVADSYHVFPYDGMAAVAPMPPIEGMRPVEDFTAEVEKKLFTYNLGHAALAYLGYLGGCTFVHEPFGNERLMAIFEGALDEACSAIEVKYSDIFTEADMEELREDIDLRFGNPMIQDTVYRVGRDPVRKLGPGDRLIGSARLCLDQGIFPENISLVCGAALCYDYTEDPDARMLQSMIAADGVEKALLEVSGIDPGSRLGERIVESYRELVQLKS